MYQNDCRLLAQSILDAYDCLMNDPELAEQTKTAIALTMIGLPELAGQVLARVPRLPEPTLHMVPLLRAKGPSMEGGD